MRKLIPIFFSLPLLGMSHPKQFVSHEALMIIVQEPASRNSPKPPIKKYENEQKTPQIQNPIQKPDCCTECCERCQDRCERMPTKVKLALVGLSVTVVTGAVTILLKLIAN